MNTLSALFMNVDCAQREVHEPKHNARERLSTKDFYTTPVEAMSQSSTVRLRTSTAHHLFLHLEDSPASAVGDLGEPTAPRTRRVRAAAVTTATSTAATTATTTYDDEAATSPPPLVGRQFASAMS